ncbi:dTDP-4-amino-4,6-dideoxygalactose transaminase [Vibrio breoganii]|uniref:dTDP-4-amino-4,6-dideoxygalactose transaminase n=1 Tax=Vibrio breoganii TaxID=553239 RepID=A0AAP8SV46_9VIBR|nr:dTDP-4-amino-4,6-dideoxygalactose transaminase [Vibrio breoganii]NMO74123.1 dTDP-4-amino-4,6-dideoxygalactose transaminase [Vibrio breoganii]NMR70868.1 dTDP-4-amino-4,6-dideoxygalactose transaminase [Vibrio breoganii]PMG02920.1 dTDP-4-amino-4,6-dideoxygalactose transaminase [Vibrio breoganii]PML88184.1 dTDP-4-amino-4,6-dideoxygalactose transaminase [Vibrio breoganii]PMP05671.1 dTDP-4-amino-4,6-dideoxygalactose transaminase [Vibrio breoganii]
MKIQNHNIPFNKPSVTGNEVVYIKNAINENKLSGDGPYAKKCEAWFEEHTGTLKALLTPSCTHALELAAILIDIKPGDEVIVPSYTFVSTANAFVLRGAKIVFVDIRPDTMNIDETKIEGAITDKTKAIVPVHYAGVACEMDVIMELATKYNLVVVEDAAQGMMATYKGKALGTIGHIGTYSFHETKNYTSGGEGGVLLINDEQYKARAEVLREKGTNRSQFFRGMVDKYTWVDIGSSMLPSEIQAAYLYAQLEQAEKINEKRLSIWNLYFQNLNEISDTFKIVLPTIPKECKHNAHMFYIKFDSMTQRQNFIQNMKQENVMCVFHYIPLHSSPAGKNLGEFHGIDNSTTIESEKLVRLPIYYNMSDEELATILRVLLKVLV